MPNLEITKMLTVSSGHVTKETYEALSTDGIRNEIMLPVYEKQFPREDECGPMLDDPVGLFVYLEPACMESAKIPEDLKPIIDLAQENGCGVLCLDCEGPELEGFAVYNW